MHELFIERLEKKLDALISGLKLQEQLNRIESKIDKLIAESAGMTAAEVAAAITKLKAVVGHLQQIK